jgi:hypothetical protein
MQKIPTLQQFSQPWEVQKSTNQQIAGVMQQHAAQIQALDQKVTHLAGLEHQLEVAAGQKFAESADFQRVVAQQVQQVASGLQQQGTQLESVQHLTQTLQTKLPLDSNLQREVRRLQTELDKALKACQQTPPSVNVQVVVPPNLSSQVVGQGGQPQTVSPPLTQVGLITGDTSDEALLARCSLPVPEKEESSFPWGFLGTQVTEPSPISHNVASSSNIAAINQASIAPVGVAPVVGGPASLPLAHPFFQQICKELNPPKFSGLGKDWHKFAKDFQMYLQEAKFGVPLTDDLRAQILKSCLDPTNQTEFNGLRAKGVSFAEYWAKLENIYGRDDGLTARGRWKSFKLYNTGKLTAADWRQFEINFKALWNEVPDATENEAYELLISNMPANFRTNIFETEESRFGNKTLLKISNIGDITAEEAKRYLKLVMGVDCSQVEKISISQYLATFENREVANKCVAFNGRPTRNGAPP